MGLRGLSSVKLFGAFKVKSGGFDVEVDLDFRASATRRKVRG